MTNVLADVRLKTGETIKNVMFDSGYKVGSTDLTTNAVHKLITKNKKQFFVQGDNISYIEIKG